MNFIYNHLHFRSEDPDAAVQPVAKAVVRPVRPDVSPVREGRVGPRVPGPREHVGRVDHPARGGRAGLAARRPRFPSHTGSGLTAQVPANLPMQPDRSSADRWPVQKMP